MKNPASGSGSFPPKPGKSGIVAVHSLRRVCALLVLILTIALSGCGGSGGSSSSSSVLRLGPASPSVVSGRSVILTAYFDQGPVHPITWSVEGGSANGTITSGGVYTAPSATGTFTVRASFTDAPSHYETIAILVVPAVSVSISSPVTNPVVIPQSRLTLGATVLGTTEHSVSWNVLGNNATIDSSGTFIAPVTPGTYRVQVRSNYDPTKTDTRDITVVANANVRLKIQGKSDVLLYMATAEAPKTAGNFVTLVNKGFYDGIVFHRYVAGFVIQGGDPLTKTLPLTDPSIGTGGPGYTIPFETNSLLNVQYALAMAHSTSKDSAGSQFYICLTDQPSLDGDYCVYGRVLSGFATVDALRVGDVIVSATTELP